MQSSTERKEGGYERVCTENERGMNHVNPVNQEDKREQICSTNCLTDGKILHDGMKSLRIEGSNDMSCSQSRDEDVRTKDELPFCLKSDG